MARPLACVLGKALGGGAPESHCQGQRRSELRERRTLGGLERIGQRAGREVVAGQEAGQSRDVSRRDQRACYLDDLRWEPCLSLPYTMPAPCLLGAGGILDVGWVLCLCLPQSQVQCRYCSVCG